MQPDEKVCKKCPYFERRNLFVPFELNESEVLIIAEAPGRDEIKADPRKPLVGRSGQLLRNHLLNPYLGPKGYDLANIVACRPPNNEAP